MTGFGNARSENENFRVTVEVKTLNSKFLDANMRLPKVFSDKEIEVRNLLNKKLIRGKTNFHLEFTAIGDNQPTASLNAKVISKYYNELKEISGNLGANDADLFKLALSLPNAVNTSNEDVIIEADWKLVLNAIETAIDGCDTFRLEEGAILQSKLMEYTETIQQHLADIEQFDDARIEAIRTRIRERITEVVDKQKIDENRFEQELIYYIEKLDINEEKVRLKKHLDHFKEVLNDEENSGKKLGFISQEIGREINTIGSKANEANLQRLVVGMKEELEKIKEQSLNIL